MGTKERVRRSEKWNCDGGTSVVFLYSCYDGMSKVLLGVDRIVFKTVIDFIIIIIIIITSTSSQQNNLNPK